MSKKMIQVITLLVVVNLISPLFAGDKPLKVYILVGQSNMQGMAGGATLQYMAKDPVTKPLLDKILDKDGKPLVYKDVHMAAFSGGNYKKPIKKNGPLTLGYGRQLREDFVFGPELGFGITMYENLKEPILIIKTAWGGMSLHTNFRSPSAGPYVMPEETKNAWAKHPNGAHGVPPESKRKEWWDAKHKETGGVYRTMIKCIKEVLKDPKTVCPAYDPAKGYELAGLVWFQGFNDAVDRDTYPHNKEDRFKTYTDNLSHFIRDVRKELNAPEMPVVIGLMGINGTAEDLKGKPGAEFRLAQGAPSKMPEFKENVFAVSTGKFWDFELQKFHKMNEKWNRQAKKELKEKNKDFDTSSMNHEEKRQHRLGGYKWIAERTKELGIEEVGEEKYNTLSKAKSNAEYHYLGCGKTMAQIGEAFAQALLEKKSK